jgi:hypothetical protein
MTGKMNDFKLIILNFYPEICKEIKLTCHVPSPTNGMDLPLFSVRCDLLLMLRISWENKWLSNILLLNKVFWIVKYEPIEFNSDGYFDQSDLIKNYVCLKFLSQFSIISCLRSNHANHYKADNSFVILLIRAVYIAAL